MSATPWHACELCGHRMTQRALYLQVSYSDLAPRWLCRSLRACAKRQDRAAPAAP